MRRKTITDQHKSWISFGIYCAGETIVLMFLEYLVLVESSPQ